MFKDFDNSNSKSWGPLAGMKKEELMRVLTRSNSKSAIKVLSKNKAYKVTPIRTFTFEQTGDTFTIMAESESMAHYMADQEYGRYKFSEFNFDVATAPKVTDRYKITRA